MIEFSSLLSQGGSAPWLFVPTAIVLGALHGLEPGHSKTMMAAFIVAIRGTVLQAVMLGLAATLSHTAVVWLVAMGGLYLGRQWDAQTSEPYFQLASAVLIVGVALWMLLRIHAQSRQAAMGVAHSHHGHDHHHDHAHAHDHDHHHDHSHHHDHHHDHKWLDLGLTGYQDAHERAHAQDIQRRFANQTVTTGQIVVFGLTGGLIPCPAAITVLMLCLQLKQVTLGAALVVSFSIGLALTLVVSGVVAALSVRYASQRMGARFEKFTRRAPYFSVGLIMLIGLYVGYHGLLGIWHGHH